MGLALETSIDDVLCTTFDLCLHGEDLKHVGEEMISVHFRCIYDNHIFLELVICDLGASEYDLLFI